MGAGTFADEQQRPQQAPAAATYASPPRVAAVAADPDSPASPAEKFHNRFKQGQTQSPPRPGQAPAAQLIDDSLARPTPPFAQHPGMHPREESNVTQGSWHTAGGSDDDGTPRNAQGAWR